MGSKSEANTYKMLETIQKKFLELKGMNEPFWGDEELLENVARQVLGKDDVRNEVLLTEKEIKSLVLKTKYQSPYTYSILFNIVQNIEEIKGDLFRNLNFNIDMPCFGTVDFDMFSAEIRPSEGNEKLIIISDGLLTFANLISKVIVQMFPLEEKDGIQKFSTKTKDILRNIEDNSDIKLHFYDLMLACLITREPPRAKPYILNQSLSAFLGMIRESFETFVVAHEYSHSVLGHLDDKSINRVSKLAAIDDGELKQIYHNWDEEMQADLYGAGLTVGIMNKRGVDLYVSMLGIIVCTKSFDLFDKIEMLRLGRTNEINISRTHPPGFVRQKIILQQYFNDSNIELFETIDIIIESLWDDFIKFFGELQDLIEKYFKRSIYDLSFKITQEFMYHLFLDHL